MVRRRNQTRTRLSLYSPRVGKVSERHRGGTSRVIRKVLVAKDQRRRGLATADTVYTSGGKVIRDVFNRLHPRGKGGRFKKK